MVKAVRSRVRALAVLALAVKHAERLLTVRVPLVSSGTLQPEEVFDIWLFSDVFIFKGGQSSIVQVAV